MNLSEEISRIKEVMNLNESEESDLVFSLFDDFTRGANIYYNPENESIWMIFPEEKIWVFQLEKDGDLWYYYNFFVDVFKYLSLDVIDNQHYITEWVKDTLKIGVRYTEAYLKNYPYGVEDVLKKGVRYTTFDIQGDDFFVKDTLKIGKKLNNDDELK